MKYMKHLFWLIVIGLSLASAEVCPVKICGLDASGKNYVAPSDAVTFPAQYSPLLSLDHHWQNTRKINDDLFYDIDVPHDDLLEAYWSIFMLYSYYNDHNQTLSDLIQNGANLHSEHSVHKREKSAACGYIKDLLAKRLLNEENREIDVVVSIYVVANYFRIPEILQATAALIAEHIDFLIYDKKVCKFRSKFKKQCSLVTRYKFSDAMLKPIMWHLMRLNPCLYDVYSKQIKIKPLGPVMPFTILSAHFLNDTQIIATLVPVDPQINHSAIVLFDVAKEKTLESVHLRFRVKKVVVNHNASVVAAVSDNKIAFFFNMWLESYSDYTMLGFKAMPELYLSPSATDGFPIIVNYAGKIWLKNVPNNSPQKIIKSISNNDSINPTTAIAFDGCKLAVAKQKSLCVWNIDPVDLHKSVNLYIDHLSVPLESLIFTQGGKKLIAAAQNNDITVWDMTKEMLHTIAHYKQEGKFVTLSSDGVLVTAAKSNDWFGNKLRLRNIHTGTLIDSAVYYGDNVLASFSPDGTKLIVTSDLIGEEHASKNDSMSLWSLVPSLREIPEELTFERIIKKYVKQRYLES